MAQVRNSTRATSASPTSRMQALVETHAQSNSTVKNEYRCRNRLKEKRIWKGGTNIMYHLVDTQIVEEVNLSVNPCSLYKCIIVGCWIAVRWADIGGMALHHLL